MNEEKFGRLTENKRKRNIVNQFRGVCRFLRTLRNKKAACTQRLMDLRKKHALGNIAGRATLTREQRLKTNKALLYLRNRSLFQLFSGWHDMFIREKQLPGKLKKAMNRIFLTDKLYGLSNIKDFVLSKGDVHRKFKNEGVRKLALLLDKNHDRALKESFATIVFGTDHGIILSSVA